MELNLKLDDINLDNYKKAVKDINNFKRELDKKYNNLKLEVGRSVINELKSNPIREIEYCDLYSVDRDNIQRLFCQKIMDMGFDSDGSYDGLKPDEWFENDTFLLRPYNWGDSDCSCGLDDEEAEYSFNNNEHRDLGFHAIDCYSCADRIVNFWYKPTNLKITWYKYPMRSAYSNQNVDVDYINAVLDDCKNSMPNK